MIQRTHCYPACLPAFQNFFHDSRTDRRERIERRQLGSMTYFTLAPCSVSRSTLGVLGVQVAAPTHIPTTGRRIARRTRATSPYNLGIKVV